MVAQNVLNDLFILGVGKCRIVGSEAFNNLLQGMLKHKYHNWIKRGRDIITSNPVIISNFHPLLLDIKRSLEYFLISISWSVSPRSFQTWPIIAERYGCIDKYKK